MLLLIRIIIINRVFLEKFMKEIKNSDFKKQIFNNLEKLPEKQKQDFLKVKNGFQDWIILKRFCQNKIFSRIR
jgi:hypothetical protein